MAENFFKSLKTELISGNKLTTREKMKLETFECIKIWYNKKRRHSILNYPIIGEFNNQKQSISKCTNYEIKLNDDKKSKITTGCPG